MYLLAPKYERKGSIYFDTIALFSIVLTLNNKIMDARDRFFEVRDALGLTDYRIYTDVEGVTKGMLDRLRQGITTEISNKWLIPFLEAYPQVNANYILTGQPPMFLEVGITEKCKHLETRLISQDDTIKNSQIYISELKERMASVEEKCKMVEMENEKLRDNLAKSREIEFFKDEAEFYKKQAMRLMEELRIKNNEFMEMKLKLEGMVTKCQ